MRIFATYLVPYCDPASVHLVRNSDLGKFETHTLPEIPTFFVLLDIFSGWWDHWR